MKDFEENIEKEIEFDFDEDQYEEFSKKMQEFSDKMEKIGKKIGKTVQKVVEKNLANLELEFTHAPHPPMPPRPPKSPHAPHAPDAPWPDGSLNSKDRERELDQARAPIEKIKMLKELLMKDIITQEDFDKKRKQIIDDI